MHHGSPDPALAGDVSVERWTCEECGTANPTALDMCSNCGLTRAADSVKLLGDGAILLAFSDPMSTMRVEPGTSVHASWYAWLQKDEERQRETGRMRLDEAFGWLVLGLLLGLVVWAAALIAAIRGQRDRAAALVAISVIAFIGDLFILRALSAG